ncbi:hotdog domain-containing protein [Nocardia sp. NPDC005366]|uniref:hotdog domain-containing protein n=1 Tax=Nocardia sp. NPDC005366 TaxID=3156878 RepID=UPI0033B5C062
MTLPDHANSHLSPDGEAASFSLLPDPEFPGWHRWQLSDPTRYNDAVLGRTLVRPEGPETARCRIFPGRHLTNLSDQVHGSAILGYIDIAFFAGLHVISGTDVAKGMTVEVSTQFMAPATQDKPLDAIVERLRETKRMFFMRGLIVQDEVRIAAFSGILRKPPAA